MKKDKALPENQDMLIYEALVNSFENLANTLLES